MVMHHGNDADDKDEDSGSLSEKHHLKARCWGVIPISSSLAV